MDRVPDDVRRSIITQTLHREPPQEHVHESVPSNDSEDAFTDGPSQKQSLGGLLEQTLGERESKQTTYSKRLQEARARAVKDDDVAMVGKLMSKFF